MQTIAIDDGLLEQATQLTGLHQQQAVETALKLLIHAKQTHLWQQQALNDSQSIQAAQAPLAQQCPQI